MSRRLTVERLFQDPPLTRPLPVDPQFCADASFCAFLRGADDDRERVDLWRHDLTDAPARCWIDARTLGSAQGTLSAAERAERERRRQFTSGVSAFAMSPDARWVLLSADGAGYLVDVSDDSIRPVTPPDTRQIHLRFSSLGKRISYVRDGNLYCYDIEQRRERPLTHDGGGVIHYGLPDFIAAEEMHRFDGHWWSADDAWLAYVRVDESPVAVSRRFEIGAEQFEVIEQRYPYTGETNAHVELLVHQWSTGNTRQIRFGTAPDDYLARVAWAGERLAVQTQSRDQKTLTLWFIEPATGASERVLDEQANTWVELHDNFVHIGPDTFVWTSERDGSARLYLYARGEVRALTPGLGRVNSVLHADRERVFFLGWQDDPTEQHLFRVSLEAADAPQILTREPGWHEVTMAPGANGYIDRVTSLEDPGRVAWIRGSADPAVVLEQPIRPGHPYFPYLEAHRAPSLGTLRAEDGQTLHYRLTRPAERDVEAGHRYPVIVSVYGGPGVQRVRNEWPPLLLQLFAHHGFGVLELDNRGSSNRARSFVDPIHGQLGSVEVADQARGVAFLHDQDWVDPARIGVFGHSYGGYMALMCLTKAPQLFRAGVAVAPVTDWRLYDTHYTERYLGTPTDNPDGYAASSVFPYLSELRGSLLVIHGMADDNVLFTHSTKLFAAMQQANQRFEMMTYPGSKHALQEREVSIHRFSLIIDFFRRSL